MLSGCSPGALGMLSRSCPDALRSSPDALRLLPKCFPDALRMLSGARWSSPELSRALRSSP
eukprot:7324694-Alexandrium_andersonii.AAC.1